MERSLGIHLSEINMKEWQDYLNNLSWEHADVVRDFWKQIVSKVPNINIPGQASFCEESGSFFLVWRNEKDDTYLDIELFFDRYEWFSRYNDKICGEDVETFEIGNNLSKLLADYSTYSIINI